MKTASDYFATNTNNMMYQMGDKSPQEKLMETVRKNRQRAVERARQMSRGKSQTSHVSRRSRYSKSSAGLKRAGPAELKLDIDMLSEKSRKSDESNGFQDHNPKDGRVYKDGACTYYSGRLVSGSGWNTTQSQFRATNRSMNRGMRARDTFMNLFPQY